MGVEPTTSRSQVQHWAPYHSATTYQHRYELNIPVGTGFELCHQICENVYCLRYPFRQRRQLESLTKIDSDIKPLTPIGHCWHIGTATKHPVPKGVKLSFVIFDIRALWRWASECPDVKKYKWRLNPVWHRMLYSCAHMATVGVKGLRLHATLPNGTTLLRRDALRIGITSVRTIPSNPPAHNHVIWNGIRSAAGRCYYVTRDEMRIRRTVTDPARTRWIVLAVITVIVSFSLVTAALRLAPQLCYNLVDSLRGNNYHQNCSLSLSLSLSLVV